MGSRRASAPKHPPNTQLTWQRLQRGWSREELVEQIKRSMQDADEAEPGLNAEVARRWETGDRKPEPRYKKHLVLVFGMTASELGLLSATESSQSQHMTMTRRTALSEHHGWSRRATMRWIEVGLAARRDEAPPGGAEGWYDVATLVKFPPPSKATAYLLAPDQPISWGADRHVVAERAGEAA